ncbi:MAG: hypothetical protein IJA87_10835 [Clostridia bacterium]|nr:hypothetical protein [Clostridia bacterium]
MISRNTGAVTADLSKIKLRFVRQVSALLSLAVASATAFLIIILPVNADLSAFQGSLLPSVLKDCLPERDIIGYAAFAVIFPLLCTAFIHLFRKLFSDGSKLRIGFCEATDFLWSAFVFAFGMAMLAAFYLHPYYADRFLFGRNKFFLALICAAFAFAVCFAYRRNLFKSANEIAAVILGTAFLILVMYAVGKYDYMLSYSSYNLHHYSAWWNPVYKVGSGLTLGDGFNELYGFYPYLVVPVLKLFGGVNQQSLSLYMSLVFTVMAACVVGFCYRFFKNKLLGVICAAGFFTLGPLAYLGNTELYFQYYPTRALFVFLVMGLIAVYCTLKKHHRLLMAVGTVLCALAIVWNTESGFVAAVIWAGFLILDKALYCGLSDKTLLKRIAFAVLSSVISVVLFVVIVEVITYLRAGVLLNKDDILFGIVAFSGAGFYMLPLKPGVWIVVVFALAYGLYSSVPYLAFARRKGEEFNGDKDSVTALFMSSVAGIGSFTYFMGRSFPTNCMTFLPWVVMICSLLADRNMSGVDYTERSGFSFAGRVSTFMKNTVCFVVIGVALCAAFTMTGNVFNADSKFNTRFSYEQTGFAEVAAQINEWTEEKCDGKTPYVLHTYAAFVQELIGVPARENVYEQINWFYYDDAHTYIEFINQHPDEPFVIDSDGVAKLNEFFPEEWAKIESDYTLSGKATHRLYVAEERTSDILLFLPKDV